MSQTDMQLLAAYAQEHSEEAFAELVRRHLPLVYSAALRQVRRPQLAEDVAQTVFTELARQAARLRPDSILSAWLYQVTNRSAIDVVRREARRQAREQITCSSNVMTANPDDSVEAEWEQIAPMLEASMQELDERDRTALLLRYFENKSLLEVGQALGASEEAARKRVGRAVERLRESFRRRGAAVGAGSLGLMLSAHAIQAAPAVLAASVTPVALLGAATAGTTAALTHTIVMTTLQKALVTTVIVAAVSTGIYQARQASRLRAENLLLRGKPAEQVNQLARERDSAVRELATVQQELAQLKAKQKPAELLHLRDKVGMLRRELSASQSDRSNASSGGMAKLLSDPSMRQYLQQAMTDKLRSMYGPLMQELQLTSEQREQFVQLVAEHGSKALGRLSAMARGETPSAAGSSDDLNMQIQALLGPTGYARFLDFSREIPARTTVSLMEAQLESNTLNPEQSARLIQIVKAEPNELTEGIVGSPDSAFLGSQADVDNFLHRLSESHGRILQQAGTVLEPEQLAALNNVLSNSINARKVSAAAWFKKP